MKRSLMYLENNVDAAIGILDRSRQLLLRLALQSTWLRQCYQKYETRTLFGLLLTTALAFPIAVLRPDFLLAMGPFVFGYPHLVASYRFLFRREKSARKTRPYFFTLFSIFTVATIVLYSCRLFFSSVAFSVWPQTLALVVLLVAHAAGWLSGKIALVTGVLTALGFIAFAWHEPLIYAGAILMIHNGIAYIHWIATCRNSTRRLVAYFGAVLFLMIHAVVLLGGVDSWLQTVHLQEWKLDATAWFLASWSQDPLVWYRWLLLYSFGLTMHYFIWLRALPESELKTNVPLCFRSSLKQWRNDLGPATFMMLLLVFGAGLTLWMLNQKTGQMIYFQIALLHGSLEVVFLPSKFFNEKNV